jgi:catechol 2,3-dioxygenase-like lactoylglutathione lyase family enzyme
MPVKRIPAHASTMPKVLRVVLNVRDFDQVVGFYRDVLALPVTGGWDRGPSDRGALVEVTHGGVVEIVGHGSDFSTPNDADLAIAIELTDREEVEAWHHRLSTAGVAATNPALQSWGHYSTSLRDPAGLEIVLYAENGRAVSQLSPGG